MSFIGGLFSGAQGANWQAERAASPEQAQELYQRQQQALEQQRAFTQLLAGAAPGALESQKLIQDQLRQQMAGKGPSVAQRQLAEATGQNVAQQASLMAGQRGASANVGLAGRNIGMAGTRAQQQAAGQAATLRAQEQLGAQGALMGLAGGQLGQLQSAQQLGIQGVGSAQQNILNAIAQRNAVQSAIAQGNQQFQSGLIGGLLGSAGTALGGMAEGGEVKAEPEEDEDSFGKSFAKNMSSPQQVQNPNYAAGMQAGKGTGSVLQSLMKKTAPVTGQTKGGYSGANLGVPTQMPQMINPVASSQAIGQLKMPFEKGGKVPAMVSPGERYLPPQEVEKVKKGVKEAHKAGKVIPGQAKVQGDSLQNDTVPATLEEGGIVIPRSVMQSKNPAEKAREFVAAVMAKQSLKRK